MIPRKIHKRTLAIVFCFVVLPWILVAVPGELAESWLSTGYSGNVYVHGWPLVHLDRTEVTAGSYLDSPKTASGEMPELEAADAAGIDKALNEFAVDHPPLRLNLGLGHEEILRISEPQTLGQNGFWADPSCWPRWGLGSDLQIRWMGVICNLLFLGLAALLFGWVVEWWVRRNNGLLKFSLRSLLVATAIAALVTGWAAREYSRHVDREQKFARLVELGILPTIMCRGRFPQVVSRLLNHGHFPGLDPSFFVAIYDDDGGSCLYVDLSDPHAMDQVNEIASALLESPIPVVLNTSPLTRQLENQLFEFENANVKGLYTEYSSRWNGFRGERSLVSGETSEDEVFPERKVNYSTKFPHLEYINLSLVPALDQEFQLEAFCGLENLESVQLNRLAEAGIKFLVRTKEQWPEVLHVEYDEDTPEESKRLLEQHFEVSEFELEY